MKRKLAYEKAKSKMEEVKKANEKGCRSLLEARLIKAEYEKTKMELEKREKDYENAKAKMDEAKREYVQQDGLLTKAVARGLRR